MFKVHLRPTSAFREISQVILMGLKKTFNVDFLIFSIISMSGKLVFNGKMIKFKLASLASPPSSASEP